MITRIYLKITSYKTGYVQNCNLKKLFQNNININVYNNRNSTINIQGLDYSDIF